MKNTFDVNEDGSEVKKEEQPKPEIDLRFEHIKQFSFVHGQLPTNFVDEANEYFNDNKIIQRDDDVPKALTNIFKNATQTYLSLYSDQIPLSLEGDRLVNIPVNCSELKLMELNEKTYTHPIDGDTDFAQRQVLISSLLFLKVPSNISEKNVNNYNGNIYFNWGVNTMSDVLMTKPKQDKLITPVVGRFVVFPSWVRWQPIPFNGDESLRIVSSKFTVHYTKG